MAQAASRTSGIRAHTKTLQTSVVAARKTRPSNFWGRRTVAPAPLADYWGGRRVLDFSVVALTTRRDRLQGAEGGHACPGLRAQEGRCRRIAGVVLEASAS